MDHYIFASMPSQAFEIRKYDIQTLMQENERRAMRRYQNDYPALKEITNLYLSEKSEAKDKKMSLAQAKSKPIG